MSSIKNLYTQTNLKVENMPRSHLAFKPDLPAPKQHNLNKLCDAGGLKYDGWRRWQKPIFNFVWIYIPIGIGSCAKYLLFSALFFSFLFAEEEARVLPPAGLLDRQIEEEYEVQIVDPEKNIPLLEVDVPDKQFDMGDETAFIKEVVIEGNTVFRNKKLKSLIHSYLGQKLSMQQIHEMCLLIQKIYVKQGYFLARVYTPEQEIHEGVLRLAVLEGRLGEVRVSGNKHYSTQFIESYFQKFKNKPVNYNSFLRELFLLNENLDLNVGLIFLKGKVFGTTDIILKVQDDRPIRLALDTNNYGSDQTSRHRTGARLDWGNFFIYGDALTAIEVVGSPMSSLDFTDLIYTVPINRYGSKMEFTYLLANFKTDNIEENLKFEGRSHIASAKFMQALHRTRSLNTDVLASFDYKQIQNFGAGIQSSFDKLRVLTGVFSCDYIDGWKGRNLVTGSIGWGIPDILGGLKSTSDQSSRVGSGGRYVKLNGSYKRLQKLPWDSMFVFSIAGQYSFDKLPLPEQLYLGGPETVRGFRLGKGLGDQGFYGTVELRVPPPLIRELKVPWIKKRWGEFVHFVGFVDHGQTFAIGQDRIREIVETPGNEYEQAALPVKRRTYLTSAGMGVRVYGPWKFEVSCDVAYPFTEDLKFSNQDVYLRIALKVL